MKIHEPKKKKNNNYDWITFQTSEKLFTHNMEK